MRTPFEQFEIIPLKELWLNTGLKLITLINIKEVLFNYLSKENNILDNYIEVIKEGYINNNLKFDLSITNLTVISIIEILILLLINRLYKQERPLVTKRVYNYIYENLYMFIYSLVEAQIGRKGGMYFPLMFSVFIYIVMSNLISLMPFSFTATSLVGITFTLSLSFIIAYIIIGLNLHGKGFFKLFIPSGVPLYLLPLLTSIEIISYLIRPFSMAIRLFANMLAGHILLSILGTAVLLFYKTFYLIGLFIMLIIMMFFLLEIFICFLQAYVFTVLLCIYLRDSYYIGH